MEDISAHHWPFVESPGEFTERLRRCLVNGGTWLGSVRSVLIENPPTISKEYLAMATGIGHCKDFNACKCGGDTIEVRATCQNWIK